MSTSHCLYFIRLLKIRRFVGAYVITGVPVATHFICLLFFGAPFRLTVQKPEMLEICLAP
jgi:hypothetical protein